MQAIHEYTTEKYSLPIMSNLKVALQPFPVNPNREDKANTIAARLLTVHQSLSQLSKLMLKHTVITNASILKILKE